MPLSRQLLQIDYDQFHRYAAVTALLRPLLRHESSNSLEPLRILEVGSHSLNLLPAFLSPLPVEVVRADIEPGLAGDLGAYVTIVPGQPLPWDTGAFDFTVALEVLEHIPPEERRSALREWARVARHGVFFSCPSGKRVRHLEQRADAAFRTRHGREHPWLEEHERFGRPTRRAVKELCSEAGLTCHRFYNSPLHEWLPLLLITEHLFEQGDKELLYRFNEMLNTRPQQLFLKQPGYRSLYAAFHLESMQSQAYQLWERAGLLGPAGRPVPGFPSNEPIDSTRVMAEQLSNFILQQRRREVDAVALAWAQRQVQEVQERLSHSERQLALHEHQMRVHPPASHIQSTCIGKVTRVQEMVQLSPTCWLVEGDCPTLEWDVPFARGWHRVIVDGVIGEACAVKLHLDYGQGFNDVHVVNLAGWPAGTHRCCFNFYLDHPTRRVRLRFTQQRGQVIELDAFQIKPRRSWQVACEGIGRLALQGITSPRQFWKNANSNLLRYGMTLTAQPPGLPFASMTPYQRWLKLQQLSAVDRQRLLSLNQVSTTKLVFFLRWNQADAVEDVARTIDSLEQQCDNHWELWIAGTLSHRNTLSNAHSQRTHWLNDKQDQSQAMQLRLCAKHSQADWLVQVGAGDQFDSDAVLHLRETIRQHPTSALLYADEDRWTHSLGADQPLLKPSLLSETVRHQPAILGQAVAVHVPTLQQLGWFNPSFEGAMLPEYFLRLQLCQKQCTQVKQVLLHRRLSPPVSQAVKLVWDRLREEYSPNQYQVDSFRAIICDARNAYPVKPTSLNQGLVSILIPSAGKVAQLNGESHLHLERCLHSLREKTTYDKVEILVSDNGHLSHEAQAAVDRYGARRVTVPGPFNFSRSINRAAQAAQGDYFVLLNDDTEIITPHWLELLLSIIHGQTGAVGARLLFPSGLVQHAGITLHAGVPIHPWYHQPLPDRTSDCLNLPRPWLAVTAACLLTPRKAFEAISGFDESFELNYNDVDFCLRLWQAGHQVMMHPAVELYHYETYRSDGRAAYRPEELERFQGRWRSVYPEDPYFRMAPGSGGAA